MFRSIPTRLSSEETAELAAQVAALAAAGLPLSPGLRAVAKELRGSRVARVLERVATELDAGRPLEEALAAQRDSVPAHLRSLVLAGTKSGRLATVLERFVEAERNRLELRQRIWASLAYPLMLVFLVLLLLALFVHWVIPEMTAIYSDAVDDRILTAEFLMTGPGSPMFMGLRFLFWLVCSLLSVVLLLWGLARLGLAVPWLRLVDAVPVLGPIWRCSRIVQLSRLMEVLVNEAIPLPDALRMTGDAIRDPRLAWACRETASRIEMGFSLSQSMAELPQFPPTLVPFVEWGQATSNLGPAFRAAAEAFEGRLHAQVALLQSILMPAAFMLTVGTVLFMMVSYAAPLVTSIQSFSNMSFQGVGQGTATSVGGPMRLLGGFGPLILGLAVLLAMRILSDPRVPAVRDATQQALHTIGSTLVAVGVLGTLTLCLGVVFAVVVAVVAGLAVIRRRRAQQYAFLGLLAAAADRLMPLAPAVEAFSREYRGSMRFRALRLVRLFRAGQPLPAALDQCRGILPREAVPVVRTGYESGALATGLRTALEAHVVYEPMLSEVLTRIAYLAVLIAVFQAVSAFLLLRIAPSMQKIYMDFGATLPELTQVATSAGLYIPLLWPIPALTSIILFYAVLRYFGLIQWRFPGTSRFMRKLDRAAILEALGLAIDRRHPVPVSMRTLAASYPVASVRARLRRSLADVEAGKPWTRSLYRHGLLGQADLAVLEAAARVGNLPWAMREMADSNRRRWTYRARTWLQTLFPVAILCASLVIGLYVVGYFLPLVRLIERLL